MSDKKWTFDYAEAELKALEAERDMLRDSRDFWRAQYERVKGAILDVTERVKADLEDTK